MEKLLKSQCMKLREPKLYWQEWFFFFPLKLMFSRTQVVAANKLG